MGECELGWRMVPKDALNAGKDGLRCKRPSDLDEHCEDNVCPCYDDCWNDTPTWKTTDLTKAQSCCKPDGWDPKTCSGDESLFLKPKLELSAEPTVGTCVIYELLVQKLPPQPTPVPTPS